jgi:signal transduction histidine kinase
LTLRTRITLAAVGVVLAVLAVLVPSVTTILSHNMRQALDQRLADQVGYATGPAAGKLLRNYPGLPFEVRIPGTLFQVLDTDGQPIEGSIQPQAIAPPEVVVPVARGEAGARYASVRRQGVPLRTITAPVNVIGFGRIGAVTLGQVDNTRATVARVQRLLIGSGLVALALAAALAWVAGRAAMRPVSEISAAARAVAGSGDPSERVAGGAHDEVGDLARTFNRMLARLEAAQAELASALETQRRFMADASHELRTPLTSLRGNVDIMARNPGMPVGEQATAVAELRDEAERMSRLVDGLLHLARGDTRNLDQEPGPVDLCAALAEQAVRARRVAPGREIRLAVPTGPVMIAVRDGLLDRALGNLLDNAVVHGGPHVVVSLQAKPGEAVVRVRDDGPGIAPEDLPHVFERFYRSRSAAARSRSGTGLGLAIAASAARGLGGDLSVASRPGQTTFELRLPLAGRPFPGPLTSRPHAHPPAARAHRAEASEQGVRGRDEGADQALTESQ